MSWHLGRMLCLDFETSGTSAHCDRIVTAAAIEVGAGFKTVAHEWLVDPVIEIPEGATAIHGVTTMDARTHGRPAVRAAKEIGEIVVSCSSSGIPIVGHNVGGYDLTMLWAELIRHGHTALAERVATVRPVVDTMVLERHLDPYRPGKPNGRRPDTACGPHTLISCCALWGIDLSAEDAHGAAADALAAGRLAWRLATQPDRFADFDGPRGVDRINPAQWPLDRLHDWQAEQYAKSAASYQAYRRGQQRTQPKEGADPTFVAATSWPIQAPPPGWTPEQLPTPREADAA